MTGGKPLTNLYVSGRNLQKQSVLTDLSLACGGIMPLSWPCASPRIIRWSRTASYTTLEPTLELTRCIESSAYPTVRLFEAGTSQRWHQHHSDEDDHYWQCQPMVASAQTFCLVPKCNFLLGGAAQATQCSSCAIAPVTTVDTVHLVHLGN